MTKFNYFKTFLAALLLLAGTVLPVSAANKYGKICIKAVGAPGGKVLASTNSGFAKVPNSSFVSGSSVYDYVCTTTSVSVVVSALKIDGIDFMAFYKDSLCSEDKRISFTVDNTNNRFNATNANLIALADLSEDPDNIPVFTFYAKYAEKEVTNWPNYGGKIKTGEKYYIYNVGCGEFLGYMYTTYYSMILTYNPNNALLFTIDTIASDKNSNPGHSYITLNGTKWIKDNGGLSSNTTAPSYAKTEELGDGYYYVYLQPTNKYWSVSNYGSITNAVKDENNERFRWKFISESAFRDLVKVKSARDTSIVINSAPTASETTYVKFDVSVIGPDSLFECTWVGTHEHFKMGTPKRALNEIWVPITYTAQNIHSGLKPNAPIAEAQVKLTAKNATLPASSKTATVSVYVDLQPKFALNVETLDWSKNGDATQIFAAGASYAASSIERLQNKLVYNPDSTTGVAINKATWTATIKGANKDQFQFANGTQSVSGSYSDGLLDVRFAPTTTGDFTATLHVVTSYTDNASHILKDSADVILKGKGAEVPQLTFSIGGGEAVAEKSYNFGEILGTNAQEVTVNLVATGIINPTKVWTASEGSFEFDVDTLDLTKTSQTLTFRAHRYEPLEEAATQTATLTISGESLDGLKTATLTLTYTAQPWLTPTVTWNWANLPENTTTSNPITTNSTGEWLLTKIDGADVTYNEESLTATTPYLHHEPKTATFAFSMLPTNDYAAVNETFVATITGPNLPVTINSPDQFGIYDRYAETYSSTNPDGIIQIHNSYNVTFNDEEDKVTIHGFEIIRINMPDAITKLSFDYAKTNEANVWTITEYYKEGGDNALHSFTALPVGHHEYTLMPNVSHVEIQSNQSSEGAFTNIQLVEYDTIETNSSVVSMVESGATGLTPFDLSMTFANKRQVTVSLSETAAQYFELSAEGKATGNTIVFGASDGLGVGTLVQNKVITIALKDGINRSSVKGDCRLILADDYTYNHEVQELPIVLTESYTVTFAHDAHATYSVTYQDDETTPHAVSKTTDYTKAMNTVAKEHCTVVLDNLATDAGYTFQGWEINGNLVSCERTATLVITSEGTVKPVLGTTIAGNFQVDDAFFDDLTAALHAADVCAKKKVVIVKQDVTIEAGDYTIPAGVALLVPHKAECVDVMQYPEVVALTASTLAAYRTLTLKPGANIICNGTICVGGKILSASGGNKSAYVTGECGVINMANGGHIELNNKATLYCWGFIKGQDMDQGNNTQNVGTVTANNGATIWENFEVGDWRGGNASLAMYNYTKERKLFPFQSYSIQNIEVPTTYKYGSLLRNYTNVYALQATNGAAFSLIGSENTLFLLKDSESIIRKWYDPTTDLMCYELSGTAQLDALHIVVYVALSSDAYNLPIANNMHIILTNCEMTLAKPIMVQAGAIIEIKSDAIINLENSMHLFDVDEWGLYIHNYYFRSFNNLTSHKNRGAENSKAGLDDAKLIVDGTLNIVKDKGYLYATSGGADVMGNHGGVINFKGALPTAGTLWQATVRNDLPYINWAPNPEDAANLHNEDGSYTRSISRASFYNIHGRWFHEEDKDPLADHTYAFTYMIDDDPQNDPVVSAVYSHDKTGLEERMKWFNVTEDENCANWWLGSNPDAQYNYSMLGEWHQFIETKTTNEYSGSNNSLYQKNECTWIEEGAVDENCLYTISGVKKALVNGQFIPLESNGYDPAYHNGDQYYICFEGCNWHEATQLDDYQKAYKVETDTFIWYNNAWMAVEFEAPFFFTADEQTNVRTYYEYVNGDWVVATPYVSVTDEAETRNFYDIHEAFRVASIKKGATITLLRDLPNTTSACVFETQNTTCTLDLNGHLLGGSVANLVTVNAPGCKFTITDTTTLKLGKIRTSASKAVYAQKGTVVLNNGTLDATGAYAIECASAGSITINGGYLAAATKCVNGTSCTINGGHFTKNTGLATYCAANKYPFETEDPKYKYEVLTAYTITFKNEAATLQTLHVKSGETPVYTANQPTKDGYKFTGWSPAIVAATAAATYTAQFTTKAAEERCVTLNSNGGNEGLQYIYVTTGSAIGTLPVATKEGHDFVGWYSTSAATGGTKLEPTDFIEADATYYARYSVKTYTLTWNANGGNLSGGTPAGQVQFGAAITAPTATKEGHTFISWNATPATTMPAQDVTYTAQWSIAVKHYLQNIDGTYPETPAATDNVSGEAGEYVTPAVKTYDGFITPATQTVRIGQTDEVAYNYARRTYTITLDANGGTCATASTDVKHGATLSLPTPTWENHSFDGWFTKAIGGDQITGETLIQRNIGTLYAHWTATNEIIAGTSNNANGRNIEVTTNRTVDALIIEKDGKVTISGEVTLTATDFILESTGFESGQLIGAEHLITANAYFDYKANAKNHLWYAVAVPWQVDANTGISVNGRTLKLGTDFDIIYYDGDRRAREGKNKCWSYVEDDGVKTLVPGRLYMIGLMSDAATIRFTKESGAGLSTTTTSVEAHAATTGDNKDANWNGVANPALFHAFVNPGTTEGQVYIPAEKRYEPIGMNEAKFVVGRGAFVQVPANKSITVSYGGAYVAPRRAQAHANLIYDVRIAPVDADYTDRLFVKTTDSKEAEVYTVGEDLAKVGVSSLVPQMWVNRYGEKLCVNTQELRNYTATYPLGISVPAEGEYTISSQSSAISDKFTLYLTLDGRVIWNLSMAPYTAYMEAGTSHRYGLRLVANAPQVVTGIEGALIDANGEVRKVLIDNQIYIIRGENVYSVDGQLVK